MVDPNAYFDCLSIGLRLQNMLDDVAIMEIHLFSYLACLLSLYKGRGVSAWGYKFAVTRQAYPYSPELDIASRRLIGSGRLTSDEKSGYLKVSDLGEEEYQFLRTLAVHSKREMFIDGACSSVLVLPIGTIRNALSQERDISSAIALKQSRVLPTEAGIDALYQQFAALSSSIGVAVEDLMVPAVVWLTYLSEIHKLQLEEIEG